MHGEAVVSGVPAKRRISRRMKFLMIFLFVLSVGFLCAVHAIKGLRTRALIGSSQVQFYSLQLGLESYKTAFGAYPPDDGVSKNGSELLWYYLAQKSTVKKTTYGPFVVLNDPVVDQRKKIVTPWGADYIYVLYLDSKTQKIMYRLTDPGPDKKLGGDFITTGEKAGQFVPTNPEEANDNLTNEP